MKKILKQIYNEQDSNIVEVKHDQGEGEGILDDLEIYALQLEQEGLLARGTVEANRSSGNPLKCGGLFKAIYQSLDGIEAIANDPRYEKMWGFSNRYLGKRSPVSRLIKMRAILGRQTELVATPEVVKNTKYELLAKK